nr:uncharacterized protein LOC128689788 isoform X1 [Cherax quadricarinatus]
MACGCPSASLRVLLGATIWAMGVGGASVESQMGVGGASVESQMGVGGASVESQMGVAGALVKEHRTTSKEQEYLEEEYHVDESRTAAGVDLENNDLLASLLRMQKVLSGIEGCDTRLQHLWRDVTAQRLTLERLQEEVFLQMDRHAKIQFEHPTRQKCPEPFQVGGGGCFYHPQRVKKTWAAARYSCGKLGADLAHPANITSFRDYITTVVSGDWGFFFLGARADPKQEFPVYRWLDGRIFGGEGRKSSESLTVDGDFCVVMLPHSWQEFEHKHCETSKGWYVCEVKVKNLPQ